MKGSKTPHTPRTNWSTKSRHERGYGSAWDKLRAAKLAADPLCAPCLALGRTTAATHVDHVTPKSRGGTDDWSNVQSICAPCHKDKTAREAAEAQGRRLKPKRTIGLDGWPI